MRPVLLCVALAMSACGKGAVAQPRKPEPEAPLIKASLDSDPELTRALRANYTKYEFRIPMRDGVKLFTSVLVPKDRSRTYPMMLERTPYSVAPYGVDNYPSEKSGRALRKVAPSPAFVRDGFIFVHQDVRGRLMSEGTFADIRPHATKKGEIDESTDAWDTVDWLVKNVPANNGRVGVWGISYPGFYAAQAAVDAHPAVKAVSPQAPVTEWFIGDDFHHNGATFLADAFGFYASFGKERPKPTKKASWGFDYDAGDIYDFFLAMGPVANANTKYLEGKIGFWNEILAHPNRDAWWKARDPRPYYKDPKPAVMTVGGWFDAEDLWGALETYRSFEKQSTKKADNVLVMGPWRHGGWARDNGDRLGDLTFGQPTSLFYREQIELPFFQKYLKDRAVTAAPEAWIFETGTNTWQRYAAWPPPSAKPVDLFFQANGKLATTPGADGFDEWVSDPQKPVPYIGRTTPELDHDYMTADQRFASRRPDVVTFATGELDGDVSVAGPIDATLWVSTTGTDADFVVKVVDVYPYDAEGMGGYQQLVRAEIMRGKFRTSFESPVPFVPGEPTLVKITLPDVAHTFRTGHKLMIQVQSSWFPLVDRNPQTFVDINRAQESDFKIATHRLYRAPGKASSVRMRVERGAF